MRFMKGKWRAAGVCGGPKDEREASCQSGEGEAEIIRAGKPTSGYRSRFYDIAAPICCSLHCPRGRLPVSGGCEPIHRTCILVTEVLGEGVGLVPRDDHVGLG